MRVVIDAAPARAPFYLSDRPHRWLAISNLRAAFPSRVEASGRRSARHACTSASGFTVLLKFNTTSSEMLAHVEFEGEERVRRGACARPWRAAVHRALGFWEINALVPRVESRRWPCSRGRSTIRCCIKLLESVLPHRQLGDLPARRDSSCCGPCGQSGGRVPDRSAHPVG